MTKKTTLLILLTGSAGWLTLTSYSSGPNTGSGGALGDLSNTGCGSPSSGCHAANNASTLVNPVVLSTSAGPVTNGQYVPGTVYTVTLTANDNSSNSTLTQFGFQTTARLVSSGGPGNAGLLASTSAQTHTYLAGGLTGIEHSSKIARQGGNVYQVSFQWTAPQAGLGAVTFFSAVNLVNNNGNVAGDQPNIGTTTFQQGMAAGLEDVGETAALTLSPNPASDRVWLDTRAWKPGDYTISIISSTGRVVSQAKLLNNGIERAEIRLPAVAAGIYSLRVAGQGGTQAAPLIIR